MNKQTIDPLKGVHNPDLLVEQLAKLKAGDRNAKNYIRGSIQYLDRFPPNKLIVPILRKALEKFA
jgi:hypothetical protein